MHLLRLMSAVLVMLPLHLNAEEVITQSVKDEADALIAKSLQSDLGYQIIESLTTEVGQRLAGTEAEARAREWGLPSLKR